MQTASVHALLIVPIRALTNENGDEGSRIPSERDTMVAGEKKKKKKNDRGRHNVFALPRTALLFLPANEHGARARVALTKSHIVYIGGAGTFEKLSAARGVTALKPRGDIPFITVQSDRDIISAIYSVVAADWSEPTHWQSSHMHICTLNS